jgi:hypothetical protein
MIEIAPYRLLPTFALATLTAACGGGSGGGGGGGAISTDSTAEAAGEDASGDGGVAGDEGVDAGANGFSQVYSTIISSQCLPCHSVGTGATEGMLDMSTEPTAYTNLVGVKAKGLGACSTSKLTRVVPGSAQTSLLYEKVESKLTQLNPPCGDSMPDDATTLSQAQVDLIQTWINEGAQM